MITWKMVAAKYKQTEHPEARKALRSLLEAGLSINEREIYAQLSQTELSTREIINKSSHGFSAQYANNLLYNLVSAGLAEKREVESNNSPPLFLYKKTSA